MHRVKAGAGRRHLQLRLAPAIVTVDAPAMMLRLAALALVLLPLQAAAADRSLIVTNFDRVRVEGPFDVRLTVGGSGGSKASVTGEPSALDTVDLDVQGTTLIVRRNGNDWSEQGKASGAAPVVALSTPTLRGATVTGTANLAIDGSTRAQRLDLQLAGSGRIDVRGADADELYATLIGSGAISVAGSVRRAQLAANGTGNIAADALIANDLKVQLVGPGDVRAQARFTADLTSNGLGSIVVRGGAKCVKHVQSGGPILCDTDGPAN